MPTFSVEELKTHLIQHTPDDALMNAYGLSPKELKDLYRQLVRAMADGSPYFDINLDND